MSSRLRCSWFPRARSWGGGPPTLLQRWGASCPPPRPHWLPASLGNCKHQSRRIDTPHPPKSTWGATSSIMSLSPAGLGTSSQLTLASKNIVPFTFPLKRLHSKTSVSSHNRRGYIYGKCNTVAMISAPRVLANMTANSGVQVIPARKSPTWKCTQFDAGHTSNMMNRQNEN